jgi:tRNA(Ile)-lysidine synthase
MDVNALRQILLYDCSLSKTGTVVVGVSGGPDSLCLLHVMHSLGYNLIAAHVNHQLRPEADQEASFVKGFAENLGIPFFQTRVDVHQFAREKKLSIEESARILRYRFLMEVAKQYSAQVLAVAHQADDQIETTLMHILRGSGMSGLKGMPYRSFLPVFSLEIPIVRPLLGVWREEILEYCVSNEIKPCFDLSNQDVHFFRNRLRQELIPLLTSYNTQAKQHLWQLAMLAGEDDALLDKQAEHALTSLITEQGDGFLALERLGFLKLDLSLQRRVIRLIIARLRSNLRDIGYEVVEKAIEFAGQESLHGECQLLAEVWLTAFRETEMMVFTDQAKFESLWPVVNSVQPIELKLAGVTKINPFWSIHAEVLNGSQLETLVENDTACFDLDLITLPLLIATGKTLERFTPFGMEEHFVKLGDLFTNLKVFPRARKSWPLLRTGGQILWVAGLRRSSTAPVTPVTKMSLRLRLSKS